MTLLLIIIAYVAGVVTTATVYRNRIREASESAAELERDVVRAAVQHGGRISAIDVRPSRGRSIADVEDERAHAYALLRTIYGTAVSDELVPVNPCRIKGAGSSRRQRIIRAATLPELEAVTANMPA